MAAVEGGRLANRRTITCCLTWTGGVDLYLHLDCPDGQRCSCDNRQLMSRPTGRKYAEMDVDKRLQKQQQNQQEEQVDNVKIENIYVDTESAPRGEYVLTIHCRHRDVSSIPHARVVWSVTCNDRGSSVYREGGLGEIDIGSTVATFMVL